MMTVEELLMYPVPLHSAPLGKNQVQMLYGYFPL